VRRRGCDSVCRSWTVPGRIRSASHIIAHQCAME
jgi:hypothetical protein